MSEELKAALARIACLEGEIAKRDARIAEMQERFDSSAHRTSLIGRLEIENDQLRAELSAIKAQGVVMPDVNAAAKALCNRHAMICGVDADDQWKEYSQDFIADAETVLANARLNAAPVQQVSVPDGKVCVPVEVLRLYEFMAASFTPFTSQQEQIAISLRKAKAAMLAAPAAPAADAGLASHLEFAVTLLTVAGLAGNAQVEAMRAALAAHRSTGVV